MVCVPRPARPRVTQYLFDNNYNHGWVFPVAGRFILIILLIFDDNCCKLISYPGNFVPKSFRIILVISYPLLFSIWSFRTQFGHFGPISYPVWSFRTYFYYFLENHFGNFVPIFYCFVPKSFRTRSHFVPILFRTHFQTRYELTLVKNDFLFCCNLLLPD